jgi:hypothetical protein
MALPESEGHTQIMVVVDRFSKMAHFIALTETATAKDAANAFFKRSMETSRITRIDHFRSRHEMDK